MSIIKSIFKVMKNGAWDEHYFKTSSDQVVHTKTDGQASTVKEQLDGLNSALSELKSFRVFVSMFSAGSQLNTDYNIPIPEEVKGNGYMLVALMVSNNPNGGLVPMESFYDINYVGILKTNGVYQITNAACLNNSARAIWVYW